MSNKGKFFKSKKDGGFVDVSFFGVLISIAILTAAGFFTYRAMVSDSYSTVLISGHRLVVKSVRENYRHSATFVGLSNTVANAANYAPESWETSATAITNNVNGAVTIAPTTCNSVTDGCFTVTHAGLDVGLCNDFVGNEFPAANAITVGSTTVKATAATAINPGAIATACNNATNSVAIQYAKS
jgi:hypothetical protein